MPCTYRQKVGLQGSVYFRPSPTSLTSFVEDREISLALCVQAPIGGAPVSLGPELAATWLSEFGGGFYRTGSKTTPCYTVLYELRRCQKEKRGWFRDKLSPVREGVDA